MPESEDEVERIIEAEIGRHSQDDPVRLGRAILEALWEAGYNVTHRLDMIPIVRNPGEGTASRYTAEQEREAQGLTTVELFQRLADDPRNAAIRDKIGDIARKLGG